MVNLSFLFSLSFAFSPVLHFKTRKCLTNARLKSTCHHSGVESARKIFIYALSEPFLDRCACSCQKHQEASAMTMRVDENQKQGRSAGEMSFRKYSRLSARALYKQKVESGVMVPIDGGCETEDKEHWCGLTRPRRGTEMVQ